DRARAVLVVCLIIGIGDPRLRAYAAGIRGERRRQQTAVTRVVSEVGHLPASIGGAGRLVAGFWITATCRIGGTRDDRGAADTRFGIARLADPVAARIVGVLRVVVFGHGHPLEQPLGTVRLARTAILEFGRLTAGNDGRDQPRRRVIDCPLLTERIG